MTNFSYMGTPFSDGDTILLLSATDDGQVQNYQFKWHGENYADEGKDVYEITDEGFDNPLIAAELWADDGLRVVTAQHPGIETQGLEQIRLEDVCLGDTIVLGYGSDHANPDLLMEVTVTEGRFVKEHLLEISGPIWDESFFIADDDVDTSEVWMMSSDEPLWLVGCKTRVANPAGATIPAYQASRMSPAQYTPAKASTAFLERMGFPVE